MSILLIFEQKIIKNMRRVILFFLGVFVFSSLNAQIGGLSASKLNTLSATTVERYKMEFEPSIGIEREIRAFHSGALTRDTTLLKSFNYRFTYGMAKNIEVGVSLPNDLSETSLGVKYNFHSTDKYKLAVLAGANLSLDNYVSMTQLAAGFIATIQYNENASTDVELGYVYNISKPDESSVFLNIDNGVYVGNIQYILGFNSLFVPDHRVVSQIWIVPGVTIEPARQFLIVLSYSHSILDSDIISQGVSFALTITLD